MNGKTKQALLKKLRSPMNRRIYKGEMLIYQYPKGHWSYCTPASPIAQSLEATGHIYPETDCKAQQFERITL